MVELSNGIIFLHQIFTKCCQCIFLDEQQWPEILPQSKKSELTSLSRAEQDKQRELERKEELSRREAEEEKSVLLNIMSLERSWWRS